MKNMAKSRKRRRKSRRSKTEEKRKNKQCFLMWLAGCWHYIVTPTQTVNNSTFWHANRLKTHQLNPTSIQPALILPAFFSLILFFFFLSLKGSSAVWWMSGLSDPPRFFGPALTFCWAKNKVHRVHTESFAALIPRKWNFTPNPKQTRPHISSHYLNELIEYKKSYQVDIQCTVSLGSLIYWSVRQKQQKTLWVIVSAEESQPGHSKVRAHETSLTPEITSVKKFNPNHTHSLRNPFFFLKTTPFPPCQVGGLSILPRRIKFPLSPGSRLLSDHRSSALLISISCRFHFHRQRQREIERRRLRGGTNTLTHHHGVSADCHLQPPTLLLHWQKGKIYAH